eukprot:6159652-Prymnesium_polylepis.1
MCHASHLARCCEIRAPSSTAPSARSHQAELQRRLLGAEAQPVHLARLARQRRRLEAARRRAAHPDVPPLGRGTIRGEREHRVRRRRGHRCEPHDGGRGAWLEREQHAADGRTLDDQHHAERHQ